MKYLSLYILLLCIWGNASGQPLDHKDMMILATQDYSFIIKERHLKKTGFEKHGEMLATIDGKKIKFNQYFHDHGFLSIVTHPTKKNETYFATYTVRFDSVAAANQYLEHARTPEFGTVRGANPMEITNGQYTLRFILSEQPNPQVKVVVYSKESENLAGIKN